MKLFLLLLLIVMTYCQQITLGMRYLSDKFYGKIDTNVYYYYQVLYETEDHCFSGNYQCSFINYQKLNDNVDHQLDSLKPQIMKSVYSFLDYLQQHQRAYFRENQRKELDLPIDKYYLL